MFNVSTADKGFTLHLNCLYQTTGEFPDNFNLEKLGNFNAGFRYEHVGFDYTDHLDAANNMTRYQNEFFPSLSWARQFGPVQTSLAYSFKTIRPNYNDLSSRITFINSYMLMQGDPTMKNAKMQEASLNARYKWLNLFAAYERRDNTMSQLPYDHYQRRVPTQCSGYGYGLRGLQFLREQVPQQPPSRHLTALYLQRL